MLHNNSSKLIGGFHSEGKSAGCKGNKIRIVKATVKLLLADIKSLNIETDWYPETRELGEVEKNVPHLLSCVLQHLTCGKKKDIQTTSLDQAIAQAARPHSALFPLQFGVAVQCLSCVWL